MRYISAWDMHFKRHLTILFCLFLAAVLWMTAASCYAEVMERVAAYVNDKAITLSEFRENAQRTRKTLADISDSDIINSMINRLLLLQEAKKMRLEAPTKDELVRDYIDIKIKSAIIIKEEDIERFFSENSAKFNGQDYFEVRDEIEKYLFEREANRHLKKHIEELRAESDIKIQLKASE
ncbi:MAG: SurA N-terminal domain-containing protein [Nitrospirae bacterium]|nr:SurA N-terminal domain-containing protein [Nitrospirota bacterium]